MVTTMGPAALLAGLVALRLGGVAAVFAVVVLGCFLVQFAAAFVAVLAAFASPSYRAALEADAVDFSAAMCSAVNA